jgi:protein-tyrosine phosphatase
VEKTVVTTGCKNFRDLGGLPCNDASFTKFHKIYRSDCLSRLTDADIEILKDKGISCIIDLRTKLELSIRPNPLANLPGFSYYNI